MKLLVAVKSCGYDHDRGAHELLKEVWGHDLAGADLRFFTARAGKADEDEIIVKAPDDYPGLPLKTREICRYTLGQNYDYIFLCDTGSLVIPHHLMDCGFQLYDYMGYWGMKIKTFSYTAADLDRSCPPVPIAVCYPWASGGGYFLSRKAMHVIAAASDPRIHAEDLWVGQVLAQSGIMLKDDSDRGFKGYVVDWIVKELNYGPLSLDHRREWMQQQYDQAKLRCETEGCLGPSWAAIRKVGDKRDPDDIENILKERREARRTKRA